MGRKYAAGINVNGINIFRKVAVVVDAILHAEERWTSPLLIEIIFTQPGRRTRDCCLRKENNPGWKYSERDARVGLRGDSKHPRAPRKSTDWEITRSPFSRTDCPPLNKAPRLSSARLLHLFHVSSTRSSNFHEAEIICRARNLESRWSNYFIPNFFDISRIEQL